MNEKFTNKNFRADTLQTINRAVAIIAQYQEQGYTLTLRQLYYQFVSRNWITNEEKSYKNLGSIISDGRLAGLIDWEAIEDRVRVPNIQQEFSDLNHLVRAASNSYRLPRWKGQDCYVELWVEKDALAGVLLPLAEEYHITLMVNRGYSSQSAMYQSAKRFLQANEEHGREGHLLYLGDHDPSGEDMVRDVHDRLALFGASVQVDKLALNMDQVRQYNPPPNPAKMSDSRAAKYVQTHGRQSWEVDALPPDRLARIIRTAVEKWVNLDLMEEIKEQEKADKAELHRAAQRITKKGKK